MSIAFPSGDEPPATSAHALAAAADARFGARIGRAVDDLLLPDQARLTERMRAAVHTTLAGIVASAEADVRSQAAGLLSARGADGMAEALLRGEPVFDRLLRSGLLCDPELMEELIASVELDLLAEALRPSAAEPGRPGLLARLGECPDGVIVAAATALMTAENRGGGSMRCGLPAELNRRLFWRVAAAVREQVSAPEGAADRDRALTEATLRSLAAHEERDRPESMATRLAAAIDARADELGPLLVEAVDDRRLTLFVAIAARAAGLDHDQVRKLVLDPDAALLALLLHAIGLERAAIARIGVALAQADPRRDLERLADAVDWAVAHDREDARAALAPLALGRDFRAAVLALARER